MEIIIILLLLLLVLENAVLFYALWPRKGRTEYITGYQSLNLSNKADKPPPEYKGMVATQQKKMRQKQRKEA